MPTNDCSAELASKLVVLQETLRPLLPGGLVIAFSGGSDSAFLLWTAEQERRRRGGRLLAVTGASPSLSAVDRDDAARFARWAGVEQRLIETHEFLDPAYTRNDTGRCFHCKTALFRNSREVARELGFSSIAYGYNASDRLDVRPGHAAACAHGVLAPLADVGLTKNDILTLMHAHGLPLANKPASPCLSSRVMTGVSVTPPKLRMIEEIETLLHGAGVEACRARLHEDGGGQSLRIETDPGAMARVLHVRDQLVASARARGCRWITLDLAGYRMGGGTAQVQQ